MTAPTAHLVFGDVERRWGLAVESAGFGVWDLDVPGQRVHYPPQWKALLGYGSSDEADDTATWRARVHPEDLPSMLDALSRHLAGHGDGYEAEFRMGAADGTYRWVLSRGRVVERAADGKALRAVGTLFDMTDRREAERLRVERDRAEAASRAKTDFLSRMSHELRTPLNAVLGFSQLLTQRLGRASLDEQRHALAHIEQCGWHLLHLIDDVLELARVESAHLDLKLETVILASLVGSVLQDHAAVAAERGITLGPVPLPDQAVVRVDASRARRALAHLLDNATRYNRPGGRVDVQLHAAPGAWTLHVVDTGAGIPAAQMTHLFEAFNRRGRMITGNEGAGVGLLLARSLAEAMGGHLRLHATGEQGTTFALTLPAVDPAVS